MIVYQGHSQMKMHPKLPNRFETSDTGCMSGRGSQTIIIIMQDTFAPEGHDARASFLQDCRAVDPMPTRIVSSWLSSPRCIRPSVNDAASRTAILQCMGWMDTAATRSASLPMQEYIHRDSPTARMIGAHPATQGVVARYAQKPASREEDSILQT